MQFARNLKFIPYEKFTNIQYIASGGFSQIYKATWSDCQISELTEKPEYKNNKQPEIILKKLNNFKRITYKELNELKIFYQFSLNANINGTKVGTNISTYFGITQDPVTHDVIIIMQYYNSGDLITYLNDNFYNFRWVTKLYSIKMTIDGLVELHSLNIIHRDLHSGNILFNRRRYEYASVVISDLGISKSATESTNNNNENDGIIPYMAPELFRGQKYTTASDIYSFAMIMWEFMTGRRPFWDEDHDTELIIKILDGLRPPIVANAPEGYVELMKECWHSDPNKRPKATDIRDKISIMHKIEHGNNCENPTEVIKSPDIGPITINNPGAVYKSRPK
ncbi:hypothetical protein RclHR1_00900025 [Rhizophagus clarus]|uniref:Kinase-like domain-containing protein n=1 Tax=Rhizophagus clarus TaxID=94130 RepID=A0A2Z6SPJ7_9GLOM|nr:hypothetical protein RclHR1_00900025 [Rhizophagus clarus]GES73263.1 kinase-like domain-containing protein [Rhizophagus clarus]